MTYCKSFDNSCYHHQCIANRFQLFSKAVKQVGDKSLQFGPPICYFFSNLESPLYLYVCNKLWYGIENISNSHSESSQLSGECMLLHSIHTLANLALKETVPPQQGCGSGGSAKILPLPLPHRSGVPKLTLPMYPFSISIDEHVPLKFLMTKRLRKITKTYLPTSI